MTLPIINLVIGVALCFFAFRMRSKPTTPAQFWIDVGLGAANIFMAVVLFIDLL